MLFFISPRIFITLIGCKRSKIIFKKYFLCFLVIPKRRVFHIIYERQYSMYNLHMSMIRRNVRFNRVKILKGIYDIFWRPRNRDRSDDDLKDFVK